MPPIEIPIKRLANGGALPLPAYATAGSAGMDIVSAETLLLKTGARHAFATGFAMAIPPGYEVQVRPRSGMALNHGITCLNTPGTIDSDYRGEVRVILANLGADDVPIARGDRIAQLVVAPVQTAMLLEVSELDDTARGSSGFGSSMTIYAIAIARSAMAKLCTMSPKSTNPLTADERSTPVGATSTL